MIGVDRLTKFLAFGLCLAVAPAAAGLNGISLDGITAPSHMDGKRVYRMLGEDDEKVGRVAADLISSYKHHSHSYRTAVFLYGLILFSDAVEDPVYRQYVTDFLNYYFDHREIANADDGSWRRPTDEEMIEHKICPWCSGGDSNITDDPQIRRRSSWIKEVDGKEYVMSFRGRMVGGPALEELALRTRDKRFMEMLERRRGRRGDRPEPEFRSYPRQLIDSSPGSGVQARMALLFDDPELFDSAVNRLFIYRKQFDPEKKVFYQGYGWGINRGAPNPGAWSRGAGWWIYGAIEALTLAPRTTPGWNDLKALLEENLEGLKRFQDTSGMWHQLIDRVDSYPETSGTSLIIYGIIRAVRNGILDESYVPMALKAFEGLKGYIDSNGIIRNCCIGCGTQDAVHDYYCRSMQVHDPHVPGPVLMAASQVIMYKKGMKPVRRYK
jgi:rhamnogalacturonyl hydrolase YesR